MGSSGNEEVRVPIRLPVETNAADAADSVEQLTDAISKSKDAIRLAAENMRNLRGKTDAVKAAKDQLKASIRSEEDAVTKATMKLLRQGTSYDRIAAQAKKLAKEQEVLRKKQEGLAKEAAKKKADLIKKSDEERARAFASAISNAGGPLARFRDVLSQVGEIAKGGGGLGVLTLAAAGATAAIVALTVAVGAGILALAKWALKGADVARSLQLVRQASTTSTLNARNLGTQVDALAMKVPTATAELNQLASSLARSRLGGRTAVDTLNAVAQASAAVDDAAGNTIKGIIERGQLSRRMFLGLRELDGTGLDFTDVASALSKNMRVSMKDAQRALLEGRVKLEDGAKAMRDAVESKFAGINLRKMMSLEGLSDTLSKKLAKMTDGIDFERAAQSAFKFLQVFDETTATGAVLKRAVTSFGNGMVSIIERGAPIAKDFVRSLIVGGLKIYIGYLQVRNAFKAAFGKDVVADFDAVGAALQVVSLWAESGKVLFTGLAISTGILVAALGGLAVGVDRFFVKPFKAAKDWFDSIDWPATGRNIIDGIISGLKGTGAMRLVDAVKDLATLAHKAFTGKLEIRSPSKLFQRSSREVPRGSAKGIEEEAPKVQRAVEAMAPSPAAGAAVGGGAPMLGRAAATVIHVHVGQIVIGGGSSSSPAEQVRDPGLLAELTKVFKEAAAAGGYTLAEEGGFD